VVVRRASYPSTEKEYKLKNLKVYDPDGLKEIHNGEDKGIRIPNFVLALGTLKPYLNLAKCKNWLRNWRRHDWKLCSGPTRNKMVRKWSN
jgi:hypothetical protein